MLQPGVEVGAELGPHQLRAVASLAEGMSWIPSIYMAICNLCSRGYDTLF